MESQPNGDALFSTEGVRNSVGVGTWAWGDRLLWGYGRGYSHPEVRGAFEASVDAGLRLFDTAEIYGFGRSERFLGEFARGQDQSIIIATKFLPMS